MSSLADCIKIHVVENERESVTSSIREKQSGHLSDGMSPEEALRRGASDAIGELMAERSDIYRQILKKIGPPKTSTQSEDSATKNIDSILGALIHGGVANSALSQAANIARAHEDAAIFEALDKLAEGSKTRARVPEKYQEFVDFLTEHNDGHVKNIYVNAELFQKAVESMPEGATIINDLGKETEFVEALETGGDLIIPVGKYARHIAGTDLSKVLAGDLRTRANGMSMTEAEQARKEWADTMKAQIDEAKAQREADGAFEKEKKQVFDDVLARRVESGKTDESARSDAAYWSAFASTWAMRYGGTPLEVYRQIAPDIVVESWADRTGEGYTQDQDTGYIKNSEGGVDFGRISGEISEKIKRQPAPIRLEKGDGHYGLVHIENGHKKQILEAGYPDVVSFVEEITSGFNEVYKGRAGTLILVKRNGGDKIAYVMLKPSEGGDFYTVNSATFAQSRYLTKKELLWSGAHYPNPMNGALNALDSGQSNSDKVSHQYDGKVNSKQIPKGSVEFGEKTIVRLFESANTSTFLHESGHIFFEFMGRSASMPNVSQELKADWQIVLDHVGNDGKSQLTREQHEHVARTMEAYFMEGKSPSMELRNVFQKFSDWLKAIYKSVSALKTPISDGIRGVMDRMFATDNDIEDIKTFYDVQKPFFKEAEIQNEADRKRYEKLKSEANLTAADKRYRSYARAYIQAMGGKKKVIENVRSDVNAMSVYSASDRIVALGGIRPDIVDAIIGEKERKALSKKRPGLIRTDGSVIPEEIADAHGFESVDDLMAALLEAETKQAIIGRMVSERLEQMQQEIRDGLSNDQLPPADKDYHSDEQMAVISAEAYMIARAKQFESGRKKSRLVQIETAAVRDVARKAVLSRKVSDAVDYYRFSLSEAKAARQAREAYKRGDLDAAEMFKRRQLLNHALVLESVAFRFEVNKGVKFVQRKMKSKTMEQDAFDMVHDVAVRFDFKNRAAGITHAESVATHNAYINEADQDGAPRKTIDFQKWAKEKEESGYPVSFPDMVANRSTSVEYKDMSVSEFREVIQAVKTISTVDMNERHVNVNGKKIAMNELTDRLVLTLKENYDLNPISHFEEKKGVYLDKLDALLVKPEFLLEAMDGGHVGAWHEAVFQGIADSESSELMRIKDVNETLQGIMGVYSKKELRDMFKNKEFIPEIGQSLTRSQILRVALDFGNEGNYSRRRDGEGWSNVQMDAINNRLTQKDVQFIQAIWDYIDTFRPEAFAIERRMTGREPERILPREFETNHGTLRGGYFPVVINPRFSDRAEELRQIESATLYASPNAGSAMTKHGHLKAREATAGGQALSNDLTDIMRHIHGVVHDITHRENIVDAAKIFRNKKIMNALTEHIGVDHARVFMPWLKNIANQRPSSIWGEGIARGVRIGTTVCKLGKISVMAQQIAGFTQTAHMLKGDSKYLAKVLINMGTKPSTIPSTVTSIMSKSPFMNTRISSYSREAYDTLSGVSAFKSSTKAVGDFVMSGIGYIQLLVDIPTWEAAYTSALKKGMSDEKSIHYADSIVRKTQGGGGSKDLAAIQMGNEYFRLGTMFYSFMNTAYNIFARSYRGRGIKYKDAASAILFVGIIGPLVSELLSGRPPDEDKDESWLKWAGKIEARFFPGMLPFIRDIVGAAMSGFGYRLSPIEGPINTIIREAGKAPKAMEEGDITPVIKSAKELAGVWFKLPTDQAFLTAEAFWAWMNSDPDFKASDLIYGGDYKN